MKASLLCVLVCICLSPYLSSASWNLQLGDQAPRGQSLNDYYEPDQIKERKPLPIKQILGLIIAGLSSIAILLFVFSFLIGPGEEFREKISQKTDPFFVVVAILLVVLFLALLQNYYNDLLAWLQFAISAE
jgi:hypothetical protein